jgi:RNA polymerase sigma-70 factor (ECF subfamily)
MACELPVPNASNIYRKEEIRGITLNYAPGVDTRFSEQSILSHSGDAERDAINELFTSCLPRLRKTAQRLTRSREDSEDVLQDALLSGFQNFNQFQRRSKFSTWMHIILCNSVRTVWRRQRCRPVAFSLDLEVWEDESLHFAGDFAANRLDPEVEYQRGETSRIIAELLEELPPKYREVVWLCKIQELKVTDAAEILGVPAGTIKARMHRARRMMEKYVNNRKARCYGTAGLRSRSPDSNSHSRGTVPGHIFVRRSTSSAPKSDEAEANTS